MRRRRILGPIAACLLAAAALAACGGGGAGAAAGPAPDRFDARRAFADLREQVALGPRPAGSEESRLLAERLRARLPRRPLRGRARRAAQRGGSLPGRGRPILVGAHYDTKDIPGFVGANDGAGGVATVLELSRALATGRRACQREIRFVMFDGEESPAGSPDSAFLRDGLRGSRAYAAAHADELAAVVVVDFVADRDLSIPRESGSSARLWRLLRASAARVGTIDAFPAGTGGRIHDDHTPFTDRGCAGDRPDRLRLPALPHAPATRLDKVSARSLDRAGEALVEMLRRLARQTC